MATTPISMVVRKKVLTFEKVPMETSVGPGRRDVHHRIEIAGLVLSLALLALGLASCRSAGEAVDEAPAIERPNILFLFADDQRTDTIGAWGHSRIQTPAIDSLVNRGTSFRNNFCMGSHHGAVCAPSRAMLMSGRHLFEVKENLADTPTMPQALAAVGYRTFGTGKWHNGEKAFDASFQSGKNVFFGGMCDHTSVLVRDKPLGGDLTEKRDGGGFSSELFADAAIEFLEGERDPDTPFFAYVAFSAPHDPRQPPKRWLDHYAKRRPPLPGNFMRLHPFHNGWMNGRDEKLAAWPRDPEVIRDQLAEYYGMISHLDEQVGRILECLARQDLLENTIVVYTADHGLALGSHGLLGKQSLYEHSMKAPLVIAGPGVPKGSTDALTYLFDLVPTLCSMAGATTPEGYAGSDLTPVLADNDARVRDVLVTSYEDKMRAIRDERWKLIVYPQRNHAQLFDLRLDRSELTNLAQRLDYADKRRELEARLRAELDRLGDETPLSSDDPKPLEYDPSGWRRAPDRWQPAWIVEKYFQGETR